MDIPLKVKLRLHDGWRAQCIAALRGLADRLHDESLDHWADEADAVADLWVAWSLLPVDLVTDEGDVAIGDELSRRVSALMQAVCDA